VAAHSEGSSDAKASEAHYRNTFALAVELDIRPLVVHCCHSLGKLYRRTGKPKQARDHLTAATTMYRERDMRFWLEQANAEMGQPQ
jgi:sugar phosphate isomerase/epimerase